MKFSKNNIIRYTPHNLGYTLIGRVLSGSHDLLYVEVLYTTDKFSFQHQFLPIENCVKIPMIKNVIPL